jgi:hypothetical protein
VVVLGAVVPLALVAQVAAEWQEATGATACWGVHKSRSCAYCSHCRFWQQ